MAKISINLATASIQNEDIIVGIDLGTTNSLVAYVHPEDKKARVLKEFGNGSLVPSIVHFGAEIHVGDDAKKYLETDAENTIYSVKRLLGKSYKDIQEANFFSYKIIDNNDDQLVKIQVKDKFYSPIELSSFILLELKNRAEHILKLSVKKCVITVPAYFNDAQRQATRDAGKLAGLEVLRIVNEPTAACLAYGLGNAAAENKTVAVYDLGGGTFDVSILKLQNGIFEVLSTHGDTYLGGDDFDKIIYRHFELQLQGNAKNISDSQEKKQSLRLIGEEAKKFLSEHDRFEKMFENTNLTITKNEFELAIKSIVDKTLFCCKSALKDAELEPNNIDEIIMVGGSTRIPLVKNKVSDFFQRKVNDNINPDEAVALGAAIQADILAGKTTDVLLLDVTPLSLGIETMGGLMDVLISRNSKIPSQASRQYTTQKDGQNGMEISVYQGERDLVSHNRKLASFTLKNIPAMPAGLPKVEIKFMLDADGILKIRAKELRSGVQQEIEVKPQYGLTDNEVEKMLLDSIQNAKDDIATRALVESKTEAEQLIAQTAQFLLKHQHLIETKEKNATTAAIQHLQKMLDTTDKNEIQLAIENLNEITRPYAERVMNKAVQEALHGKNI